MIKTGLPFLAFLALSTPAIARDSLGVYSNWAAFRDDSPSRCYAIAKPRGSNASASFASIANWPDKGVRGQLHLRLSRSVDEKGEATLTIGSDTFTLVAKDRNAWASDARMDAQIVAAMRSASRMSVAARSANGSRFSDSYSLSGVATAMDAATVGCANRG
ncbi:hypothetical protein INR77_11495 [Erythrobacter sp. SCSIO 43205]|uniref:invasion associated locus B family protein n=1 Tax=Erythrobacter sp. SCSIO 43205 TaxID=2779361 RepID=UPI001CA803A1|nr:invasion associated locus B family protein [Erythrobacter sp. SCSIO 43205]UAB77419.1 hypothetical protein INR77_11495 [Erythrobacter sp. SCSIO 43205]